MTACPWVPYVKWARTTCSRREAFSRAHLYVPASAIANVEHEVVHLNLAKREAEQMGWEEPPREPDAPDGVAETDDLHRHV